MSLMRLVYASRSRLVEGHRAAELGRIVATANRLNAENHITGFLLATPGAFAQVLEGAQIDVAETYGRIVTDPRHTGIRLLAEQPLRARGFSQWSMGVAERDETTAFIFGLYGVSPEHDLQDQPVEALLDLAGELSRHRAWRLSPTERLLLLQKQFVALDLARHHGGHEGWCELVGIGRHRG